MKQRILIVEDDPAISRLLGSNLSVAGYETVCAMDGQQALDAIAAQSFALALCDIMLPELDGFELLPFMQSKGIPVIYVSAKADVQGRIHGIVGRNGSGKTVLMKCICGFLLPTSGSVQVFGKRIGRDCDFAPDTGMLIESPGFLPHETGLKNLLWLARLGKSAPREKVKSLLALVGLEPSLRKPVSQYSLGMRQRLGIAQTLLDEPSLLILDEPMNGLDHGGVQDIRALLLSLKAQGKTILLASHFAQDIDEWCDTVYEMERGTGIRALQV